MFGSSARRQVCVLSTSIRENKGATGGLPLHAPALLPVMYARRRARIQFDGLAEDELPCPNVLYYSIDPILFIGTTNSN